MFGIIFNLGVISGLTQGKVGVYVGVIAGCSVFGALGSFLAIKFGDPLIEPVLSAIGCAALIALLMTPLTTVKSYIKIGAMVLGAVLGWFIATKIKRYIRAGVTAFIGAFLIFKGIGSFAGNFPSFNEDSLKS